jgi:hypothetical protein
MRRIMPNLFWSIVHCVCTWKLRFGNDKLPVCVGSSVDDCTTQERWAHQGNREDQTLWAHAEHMRHVVQTKWVHFVTFPVLKVL